LRKGLQEESEFTLYLVSFYWAVTTVTTVGFGDLYAETASEKAIAMVWMLVGVGLYSFIVGTLSSAISGLGGVAALIETKLQQVELFAKDTDLPRKTIRMITTQVKSVAEGSLLPEQPRIQLLQTCSHSLRKDIIRQMHNSAVSHVQLLSQLNMACLASLMPRTIRRTYEQDDVIYEKGEVADKVYFLLEGRVRCLLPGRGLLFKTLVSGSWFGETEALEGSFREFTVESATNSVLLELDREVLLHEMEAFADVRSKVLTLLEWRKEKDRERMEELLDLLEAVEIRHEATFQDLAGRAKVSYSSSKTLFSVPSLALSLSTSLHHTNVLHI
jgi:CRP-like cAMP-binding protein